MSRIKDIRKAAKELDVKIIDEEIGPGDLYLAARNGPVQLLICDFVSSAGWIRPKEQAYAFDTHECYKVREKMKG